jgi:Mechanosensitive ion channel, conserved TM helix
MVQTVQNWGDAVLVSVTTALQNLLGFLPALIGAIIVLIVGWIIAGLLAGVVERVLKTVGFERASESTGISGFIRQAGSGWTASKIVAEIVKWFIRLVAIQAAASILGLTQISAAINAVLLWLPNLVVALVIIVVAALLANFVAGIVRGAASEMGFASPALMANVARYAIIAFAVVAAINQLGIAPTVVDTLLIGTVGAVALALGLAFGLGGRDVAARITESWYASGQQAAQRVAQYAQEQGTAAQTPGASTTAGGSTSSAPAPGSPR